MFSIGEQAARLGTWHKSAKDNPPPQVDVTKPGERMAQVIAFLKSQTKEMNTREIAEAMGLPANIVSHALVRAARMKRITRLGETGRGGGKCGIWKYGWSDNADK